MDTLLCPTDFSPSSGNALRYAHQLAQWLKARMVLFHNIYEPAAPGIKSYGGVLYAEPIRDPGYRQALLDRLEAWQEKLGSTGGSLPISYVSKVRYGLTQDNIAAEAIANAADLVILGSKRGEGLKQLISGSVVGEVIRQSPCPVLIIPPDASFTPLTRIIFATSLFGVETADMSFIARLAQVFQAEVIILHILTEYTIESRQQTEEAFDQLRQRLPYPATFHIETHEDIADGISQFTRQFQADMLIMGYHAHSFWERFFLGDHTKKLVSQTTLPLLVIHH